MKCPRCTSESIAKGELMPAEFSLTDIPFHLFRSTSLNFISASLCKNCGLLFDFETDADNLRKIIGKE